MLKSKWCGELGWEDMDPVGYFLIKTTGDNLIEVGLCGYKKINVVKRIWQGDKPQNIYRQVCKDLSKIRADHAAYLGKELTRAYICMKLGIKYVQDGGKDGEILEPIILKAKEGKE